MSSLFAQFFPQGDGSAAVRDPAGGTLLHWCTLLGAGDAHARSELHRAVARHIIDKAPLALLDLQYDRNSPQVMREAPGRRVWEAQGYGKQFPYSKLLYDGESALHIAVAKNDEELVRSLLARGVDLRLRAYGSFFQPGGSENEVTCYFGEYALSFAASGGLHKVAGLLLKHDSEIARLVDTFGNTCFHLAVLHRRLDTYEYLLRETGLPASEVAQWKGALAMTPLSLAAIAHSEKKSDLADLDDDFTRILNTTRVVQWDFIDVVTYSCSLAQIDTVGVAKNTAPVKPLTASTDGLLPPRESFAIDIEGPVLPSPSAGSAPSLAAPSPADGRRASSNSLAIRPPPMPEAASAQVEDDEDEEAKTYALLNIGMHARKLLGPATSTPLTDFVPVLSLILQFNLLYLADDPMIVAMLQAKWHVVRVAFYGAMLWHAAYLALITTLLVKPDADRSDGVLTACLAMTLAMVAQNSYDVYVGFVLCWNTLRLRRREVTRSPPPQGVHGSEAMWIRYSSYEVDTVAAFKSGGYLGSRYPNAMFMLSAFSMTGFEIVSWVGWAWFLAYYFHDDTADDDSLLTAGNVTVTAVLAAGKAVKPDNSLPHFFLGLSTMCAWISTLTYAPVHVRTGMFVTMMTRTIFRDLFPFMLVFTFLLVGCTTAVYSLQRDGISFAVVLDELKDTMVPVVEGNERLNLFAESTTPKLGPVRWFQTVAYIFIVAFTLLSAVLMLNLLIASFSSTYEEVKDRAHREWRLNWGRDIMLLERRFCLFSYLAGKLRVNHGGSPDTHLFMTIMKKPRVHVRRVSTIAGDVSVGGTPATPYMEPPSASESAACDFAPKRKKKKKKKKKPHEPAEQVESQTRTIGCRTCAAELIFTSPTYPVKVRDFSSTNTCFPHTTPQVECPQCATVTRIGAPDARPTDADTDSDAPPRGTTPFVRPSSASPVPSPPALPGYPASNGV